MKDLLKLYGVLKPTFEKIYNIHLCGVDELDELLGFIDEYWQKGHVLTKSKELLNWQHFDKNNQCYNFVIATTNDTGEIHGILGFILSSIYDYDITTPIRWGAIWKIREDVAVKGLGVMLKGFLEQKVPVNYIGGVGLSKYSKAIDKKLGERMGRLSQYYIANPYIKDYKLISNPLFQDNIPKNNKRLRYILEENFVEYAKKIENKIMPYKSVKYYINRYYRHPIYKYESIGIVENDEVIAILMIRKAYYKQDSCIFVVDFIGNGSELSGCYEQFLDLLQRNSAEYICFPCCGIKDSYMREAGFCLRDDSSVILPIYYEPFERKNVELDFHFWTDSKFSDEIIVKGDSDQDRPNRI